jgi:hypothetical protein
LSKPTAGQKAAATKRNKYGQDGLSAIAAKAYRTRQERKAERLTALERHLVRVASGAKSRARRTGLSCEDDLVGWAIATMIAQNHRCVLSGVPFRLDVLGHGAAPRPYAPSIDRRDATRGYTKDNIRIICWASNCLLGTWGDEPALEIAKGIAKNAV